MRFDFSRLDSEGERVAKLFQAELDARGRGDENWTIWQNHDGVYVRLDAVSKEHEPLLIGAVDLRVLKVEDYNIVDEIRDYLRTVLDPRDE